MTDTSIPARERLPVGCHLGLWHQWGRWSEHGVVSSFDNIIDADALTKIETGRAVIQRRECRRCGAFQHRRSTL